MKKKNKMNNFGFELDSMIGFLVAFGFVILVIIILAITNKFM